MLTLPLLSRAPQPIEHKTMHNSMTVARAATAPLKATTIPRLRCEARDLFPGASGSRRKAFWDP